MRRWHSQNDTKIELGPFPAELASCRKLGFKKPCDRLSTH